ncbi:MAG: hypothetical protein DRJ52_03440 [Thermoprotei archaeon]|nr:MAG: hypothetical protein DRJ52_03440 [Thermoprotei archaeon]
MEDILVAMNIVLSNKREICGNILSAVLGETGVKRLYFGEYFRGEPFAEIEAAKKPSILVETWDLKGIERILEVEGVFLREFISIYKDIIVYSLEFPRECSLCLKGRIIPHYWSSRDNIDEMTREGRFKGEVIDNSTFLVFYENRLFAVKCNQNLDINVKKSKVEFRAETMSKDFVLVASGGVSKETVLREVSSAVENPLKIAGLRAKWIKSLLSKTRPLQTKRKDFTDLWKYCWYVILTNRSVIENHPILVKPFNMPTKYVFRHQWLWDSAFHAIVLSLYDVNLAKEELYNLFYAQKPDGRIPHEIFLSKIICRRLWHVDDYCPWTTQPPVLAVAIKRILDEKYDRDFAKLAFEKLLKYDEWFSTKRDADQDNLVSYIDYLESGWDNSVRWDDPVTRLQEKPDYYHSFYPRARMAPVEAIDLNCLIYIQRKTISELAKRLGDHRTSEKYSTLAEETRRKILQYMWDEETGFFYDVYEDTHEKILVKTPAAFLTMFAKIATQKQAEKLVKHLFDPREFWTTFPLPSVSADNPKYDPKGYWRGRTWINMIWFTYWGLVNYGYLNEAKKLALRTLELMSRGPTCYENYNSSTGEPIGAPDFGWSTLVIDLMKDLERRKILD